MPVADFFIDLLTFFRFEFEGTFNNIPQQNELSIFYLILNFLFLTLVPFINTNGS